MKLTLLSALIFAIQLASPIAKAQLMMPPMAWYEATDGAVYCGEISPDRRTVEANPSLTLDDCRRALRTISHWIPSSRKGVAQCAELSRDKRFVIGPLDPSICIQRNGTKLEWKNNMCLRVSPIEGLIIDRLADSACPARLSPQPQVIEAPKPVATPRATPPTSASSLNPAPTTVVPPSLAPAPAPAPAPNAQPKPDLIPVTSRERYQWQDESRSVCVEHDKAGRAMHLVPPGRCQK